MSNNLDENNPVFWDELYREGRTPWDLGSPTPVFADLLQSGVLAPGRTLILGCGKGYDAALFSEHGFEVTAVDFSLEALNHARRYVASCPRPVTFLHQNLFSLSPTYDLSFDYVVEYVTFCAVNPRNRQAFARTVANLLKPGGKLLGLFFPLDDRPGGPPFVVHWDEVIRVFGKHLVLMSSETPRRSVGPRKGKEMMTIWEKPLRAVPQQSSA